MIKFGIARKYGKDLERYIDSISSQNVDAFEIGFAYGVPNTFPKNFIEKAKSKKVHLSGHLPFWINLGNLDNTEKNIKYLVDGIKVAEELKSTIVFHLGFYGKNNFEAIKQNIIYCFEKALEKIPLKKGRIGIETTGKQKAVGTISEIIDIVNTINICTFIQNFL